MVLNPKIGMTVQVVNTGQIYDSYEEMAKTLKATNWIEGSGYSTKDKFGIIRNFKKQEQRVSDDYYWILVDINGQEIVIGSAGLKELSDWDD